MKKIVLFFTLLCIISHCVYSESFRVRKVVQIKMNDEMQTKTITLGMGEGLHILLPEERLFMHGLEMKITIPASLADYGGAVAYSFYNDVNPAPNVEVIDYSATRLLIDTFSNRLTYYLNIPLDAERKELVDPYTTSIILPIDTPINEIFFRVFIAMKGIPDGLWDSTVEVELKPQYSNKGLLNLSVIYPNEIRGNEDDFPFIVFIDDDLREFSNEAMVLDSGMHHVTVSSEFFRNEVRTFTIEKTKETNITIQLQDIAPLLAISAPDNTKFFLNDVEYEDFSEPIKITTGTHRLKFAIGEYEVIRNIEVLNGRTYNIDVSFDIDVTEE